MTRVSEMKYPTRCPRCKSVFDADKTFWWSADYHGDPTIENIACPHCGASTKPRDGRKRAYSYDSFEDVK